MKEWYERNYRVLMLVFMSVELLLLLHLAVVDTLMLLKVVK